MSPMVFALLILFLVETFRLHSPDPEVHECESTFHGVHFEPQVSPCRVYTADGLHLVGLIQVVLHRGSGIQTAPSTESSYNVHLYA